MGFAIYLNDLPHHFRKPQFETIHRFHSPSPVSRRFIVLPFRRASFTSSMKINSPVVEQQTNNSWREMSTAISVWWTIFHPPVWQGSILFFRGRVIDSWNTAGDPGLKNFPIIVDKSPSNPHATLGEVPSLLHHGWKCQAEWIFLQSIWRVTFPINLRREDK